MRFSSARFSVAAITYLIPTALLAQQVTYLDENYKAASATSYKYKRVITYKGPRMNANLGTGYYGNFTSHLTETGVQNCSLADYYKDGAPALLVNIISFSKDCKDFLFNGQAVAYYPDGHIKVKAYYNAGKLQGDEIAYNEDGSVKNTTHYENGAKIDTKQFAVSGNNPLLGTWKSVKYADFTPPRGVPRSIQETNVAVFWANGVVQVSSVALNGIQRSTYQSNWKYIPKGATTGVLEQYLGTDLLFRGDVTWINRNKFEYVVTFYQDANKVGMHLTYERE